MANKILTLASEFKELRSKWQTLSLYERFEQTVVAILTLVIAIIVAISTLECPANSVPVEVRQTGMEGGWNGARKEAYA